MPGYEDLTSEQIMHLANVALAVAIAIMLSRIIPAILNYRATKYLSVKIETKTEEKERKTPFEKFWSWLKERKTRKENYHPYYSNVTKRR